MKKWRGSRLIRWRIKEEAEERGIHEEENIEEKKD